MVADHPEVEAAGLQADHALDGAHLHEFDVETPVPALVREGAFRRAGLEFGVRVIRDAHAVGEGTHEAAGHRRLAREVPAALAQADADILLGDAVSGVQAGVGKADITIGRQVRDAEARATVVRRRVGDAPHRGQQVFGGLVEPIEVVGEGPDRPFGEDARGTEPIDGTHAPDDGLPLGQALVGDARVDEVDHAAKDAVAVEEGGRSAQDLGFPDGQGVHADRVVQARGGGVEAADSVLGDLEAIAVEAADDGAAGVGAEVAGGHAGQVREEVADVGLGQALKRLRREDEGRRDRGHLPADGRPLDHHQLELLRGGWFILGGQGQGRGRDHEHGAKRRK